jgi:dTDP-4-dehydrorhamnose reductase
MKIVVTGKYGLLTSELQKIDDGILGLSKEEYDIVDRSIISKLEKINPDIIIHASAITDSKAVTKEPILSIKTNIIGTANISEYCLLNNKRLVYISTDYVYPGLSGDYKETDSLLPINDYAWTKLGGECSVRMVRNHLIVRTSFGSSVFPYEKAWINQIVSKDYVDIIAPKILMASKSDNIGVLNIGTEPKTIFDYAHKRNNLVQEAHLENQKNFSLNLEKYEKLYSNR